MKFINCFLWVFSFAIASVAVANQQAYMELDQFGRPIQRVAGPQLGLQPSSMATYDDCLQVQPQYGQLGPQQMMRNTQQIRQTPGTHYYQQ